MISFWQHARTSARARSCAFIGVVQGASKIAQAITHGTHEDVHACRLGFYSDSYLDEKAISSHVISTETAMPVVTLMGVVDTEMGSKHLFDEKVY